MNFVDLAKNLTRNFRHYFYTLRPEYVIPMTPKLPWFRQTRHVSSEESSNRFSSSRKRTLILSQSMVIDMDPNKVTDLLRMRIGQELITFGSHSEERPSRNRRSPPRHYP